MLYVVVIIVFNEMYNILMRKCVIRYANWLETGFIGLVNDNVQEFCKLLNLQYISNTFQLEFKTILNTLCVFDYKV